MPLPSGIVYESATSPPLLRRGATLQASCRVVFLYERSHAPLLEGREGGGGEDEAAGGFLVRPALPLHEVGDHLQGIRAMAARQRSDERVADREGRNEAGEESVYLHSERTVHLFCTEF